MSKKIGRPKLPKDQAKGVLFAARFAPQEAKTISTAISHSGRSKSDWVRGALLAVAKTIQPA